MVDGLHYLGGEIDHVRVVVPLEAELYARHGLHLIGLFEQDHQLPDYVVYARTDLAQADDVSANSLGLEVLRGSWTRTHEFLLGLHALPRPEDAVLYDELARLDECFGHEEGLA